MPAQSTSAPPLAVLSIIVSTTLLGLGNGLLFAYIPLKLAADGFAPWVPGAIVTCMSIGGLIGCLAAGPLVRRAGHARIYAMMAALTILAALILNIGVDVPSWLAARAMYGFAISGAFIVVQSWLNDAVSNEWRGKVITGFYTTYTLSIGLGGFLIRFLDIEGNQTPIVSVWLVTLAILPVVLTRLPNPSPPNNVAIALAKTWKSSPVGLVGLLAAGGLTMMIQGFAPIYVATSGVPKESIATLILTMQFGLIAIQFPLGALSDRIDRRIVLLMACAMTASMAALALYVDVGAVLLLSIVFAIWLGSTETVYAVATAHTNDRGDPADYVSISSTLLVAWSVAGIVVPFFTTILTEMIGTTAFMYVAVVLAVSYAAFVVWRMGMRTAVPEDEQEPFQPISGQAPFSPDLSPVAEEADAAVRTLEPVR